LDRFTLPAIVTVLGGGDESMPRSMLQIPPGIRLRG